MLPLCPSCLRGEYAATVGSGFTLLQVTPELQASGVKRATYDVAAASNAYGG